MVYSTVNEWAQRVLTPQNSTLLLRVKSVVRLDFTQKSSFLVRH